MENGDDVPMDIEDRKRMTKVLLISLQLDQIGKWREKLMRKGDTSARTLDELLLDDNWEDPPFTPDQQSMWDYLEALAKSLRDEMGRCVHRHADQPWGVGSPL